MEIGFRALLLLAKENNTWAMARLAAMYAPLTYRFSLIDGVVDEDLRQELVFTLVNCAIKIRFF